MSDRPAEKHYIMSIVFPYYDIDLGEETIQVRSTEFKDRTEADLRTVQAISMGIIHFVGGAEHHIPAHRILQVTVKEI